MAGIQQAAESSTERTLCEQGPRLASSRGRLLPGSRPGSISTRHGTEHLLQATAVKSCGDSTLQPLRKGW